MSVSKKIITGALVATIAMPLISSQMDSIEKQADAAEFKLGKPVLEITSSHTGDLLGYNEEDHDFSKHESEDDEFIPDPDFDNDSSDNEVNYEEYDL